MGVLRSLFIISEIVERSSSQSKLRKKLTIVCQYATPERGERDGQQWSMKRTEDVQIWVTLKSYSIQVPDFSFEPITKKLTRHSRQGSTENS
jgi:hypothetical protein